MSCASPSPSWTTLKDALSAIAYGDGYGILYDLTSYTAMYVVQRGVRPACYYTRPLCASCSRGRTYCARCATCEPCAWGSAAQGWSCRPGTGMRRSRSGRCVRRGPLARILSTGRSGRAGDAIDVEFLEAIKRLSGVVFRFGKNS